jgi:hypothetical protein
MVELNWKIGVEIELVAPKRFNRRDLALEIAQQHDGIVRPFFHPQSEPSKVPGKPLFQNLTLGFEVIDSQNGAMIAQCVDDLTLQDDFDKSHPPQPGWYRIVSDEGRLLRLIMQQANPEAPLSEVLVPIAHLFGTEPKTGQGDMVRVADDTGASIAIAAPLPGERERPCELITPPIDSHHLDYLESLLAIARSMGFTVPNEGAIHIHFDAEPLQSTPVLVNLMRLLWHFGTDLRHKVGTNTRCRRLGKWHQELYQFVQKPYFIHLPWEEAKERLAKFEITKYCDFNIKNLIHPTPAKHTFEVRIFPVWLHGQPIIEAAALFEAILRWAMDFKENTPIKNIPPDIKTLLHDLPLSQELRQIWQKK